MVATTHLLRASECSFDDLAVAFNRGFEGDQVPPAMTPPAMEERVTDQDIVLDGSFVLRGADGPAGLALMGVRGERAWCGELAVAPAYRRQGFGRSLLKRLIEEARARKLAQMWLEVLTQNTAAFQLYQNLGFRIERELTTYQGPLGHEVARRAFTGPLLMPDLGGDGEEEPAAERIPAAADAGAVLEQYAALQLVRPSWELELPPLQRWAAAGRLHALVVPGEDESGAPDAYLLSSVRDGEVWLLGFGARPGADVTGGLELATALVSALTQQYAGAVFHAPEVPPGDPRGPVLEAAGCPVVRHFFEMALAL